MEMGNPECAELPGREGIDGVVAALKDGSSGIEDGIVQRGGLREIHVEGADEMFAANVEQRDGDRGVIGDLFFKCQADLLDARSDEVGGEGGDVVGDALGESRGKSAVRGVERTTYQRVGISGEDEVVVVVRVVEEDLGVGDAVFGLHDGVVNLRDANEEDAVSAADYEWTPVAEGSRRIRRAGRSCKA